MILKEFPYSPTQGQEILIRMLAEFVVAQNDQFPLFLLEGFAGTGKTTIVSTLVKVLPKAGYQAVLLAPTGRAAKVLSGYASRPAHTLHKRLYRPKLNPEGQVAFSLMPNTMSNAVFIVDEASMIPDASGGSDNAVFQSRNLLEDLIQHVYSSQNCKMIFLGDTAQLPPVGINQSPALDKELLQKSYYLDLHHYRLGDVVRQALESGILSVATGIRHKIGIPGSSLPLFGKENNFPDVISIPGSEMIDAIHSAYSSHGLKETVIITRSNKRANQFNQAVRQRILFQENEIAAGDHLMVVRNNYFWLPEDSKAGFIANGDIVEVLRIGGYEELYGLRFANATVQMIDYPDEPALEVKVMLDTLQSESPALSYEQNRKLFEEVWADYESVKSRRKRLAEVKVNPFYNALQVKHAHALTCHKTQGGQWEAVFLEKGFLKEDQLNDEYFRWLYTAVTRASKVLYLVNFDHVFFE
ncbi:MAG: AAA family ATPase [Bacteroidetes bacterium]|nr:AAA family ATPase [Bacteroidota bacterium]